MNQNLKDRLVIIHEEMFDRLIPIAEEALLEEIVLNQESYRFPRNETFLLNIYTISEYNDSDYDLVCKVYHEDEIVYDLGNDSNLIYILGEFTRDIVGAEVNLANKTCKILLRNK